jgi:hypothetical protein
MGEPLPVLDRASRAEAPGLLLNAPAPAVYCHAKRDLLLAIDKTGAHPAHT